MSLSNSTMNKKQHLNTINDLKIVLKQSNLLQQFAISRLGVFGSFARNEMAHDIDLLIENDLSLETAWHKTKFRKLSR